MSLWTVIWKETWILQIIPLWRVTIQPCSLSPRGFASKPILQWPQSKHVSWEEVTRKQTFWRQIRKKTCVQTRWEQSLSSSVMQLQCSCMTDSRKLAQVTCTQLQAHTYPFSLLLPRGTIHCISGSVCSQPILQAHSHSLGQIIDGHTLRKTMQARTQKGSLLPSFHWAAFRMTEIPNSWICTSTNKSLWAHVLRNIHDCRSDRKASLSKVDFGWSS